MWDIDVKTGFQIPRFIIVTFENNVVKGQTNDSSIFNEKYVTEPFCKNDSVLNPEDGMNINYGSKNYKAAYKEIVNFNNIYRGLLDVVYHI